MRSALAEAAHLRNDVVERQGFIVKVTSGFSSAIFPAGLFFSSARSSWGFGWHHAGAA